MKHTHAKYIFLYGWNLSIQAAEFEGFCLKEKYVRNIVEVIINIQILISLTTAVLAKYLCQREVSTIKYGRSLHTGPSVSHEVSSVSAFWLPVTAELLLGGFLILHVRSFSFWLCQKLKDLSRKCLRKIEVEKNSKIRSLNSCSFSPGQIRLH